MMEKKEGSLELEIQDVADKFLEKSRDKEILVVSHFDTDGITSAAIMIQALKRLDKKFSVKIVKTLDEEIILNLPKNKLVMFLDLASSSFDYIEKAGLEEVFIIDHHEVVQEPFKSIIILNPMITTQEKISGAGLTYLFCKALDNKNKELAKLSVLGMIGDIMEDSIENLGEQELNGGEIKIKKGIRIYPSTRPINRALEYCSQPYIPGVTGNYQGVLEILREISIEPLNGKYKSLIELNDEEIKKLVAAIILRNPKAKNKDIIGNIYLLKFFNKLDDARELSAMINACSRLGESSIALQFCLEVPHARKKAEEIHARYKQHLIAGLKFMSNAEKIQGKQFVIINAQDNIKDTIIGTIASILSKSSFYEEGTVIITMAYNEDKIKVSARNVGDTGRNVREVLDSAVKKIGGEVGGHEFAAGCTISKENEKVFIDTLRKNLEIELVKI